MAEMQALLVAMGAVHASGKTAGGHAASGKLPAGEGFFATLNASIEASLAADTALAAGQNNQSTEPRLAGTDASRLAAGPHPSVRSKAQLAAELLGTEQPADIPGLGSAVSQDQIMPALAMIWAAGQPQAVVPQGLPMEDALPASGGEIARALLATDSRQSSRPDTHEIARTSAGLAAAGQNLPPASDQPELASSVKAADLTADQTQEARAQLQAALAGQPLKLQSVEPADAQTGLVTVDAAREQLAQRVMDPTVRAAEATTASSTVQAPMRSPAFVPEFADRLVWMANRQQQSAELTLNPPQLGTVEVRLSMNGNEAGAQFYSSNPHVREALDQAMPKLRDIMAGAGITLGQATVSDQAFARQDQPTRDQKPAPLLAGNEPPPAQSGVLPLRSGVGMGLVDLYA